MALKPAAPQAVVIFGASGDLTRRKLIPAFYHLFVEGMLPQAFGIVGYARTEMSDEQFRELAAESVREFAKVDPGGEQWDEFARRLFYVTGEFDSEHAMAHLREHLEWLDRELGTAGGRFYYAATPPAAYPQLVSRLAEEDMHRGARIVIEKPFGYDLDSARELNLALHEVFEESQIFRIDHYLGKETVQNILVFRFANGMFEPIWNRRYIDNVQITVAEEIGVEGRGSFYEQTGALRDMVQTHLLQMMTFVAMEPPLSFEPERLRDEKVRVLRAMQLCDPQCVVRGQYAGYRDEPDVAPDSDVETYAALQLEIDNWRWAGVKFNLRTGKRLTRKATEVSLSFKEVPYNVFRGTEAVPPGRDALAFRLQPDEGLSIHLNIKRPGPGIEMDRAELDFDYDDRYPPLIDAYALLLLEAMEGDHTLFTRWDGVERAWEVLTPVLRNPRPLRTYEPGTWGPPDADELILPRHWHLTPPHAGR